MRWVRDYKPEPEKGRLFRRALIITLAGNIVLAVTKAIAARLSGSAALFADAANSVSDVAYSVMMVLGLWMAQRPPDIGHPQGHSRFEPLVGLMVTFSMAFAGYEAARNSIERFVVGGETIQMGLPVFVLLFAAAVKAGMFGSIRSIAKKVDSPTLSTTAADNLSDVLTSAAAFVGILGSSLWPVLDPIAGIVVAVWIFRAVYNAGKENLKFLTGAGASEETRQQIVEVAEKVPGVLRVHHMMTDYVGPKLVIELHVNMDGAMTLSEAHLVSDEITRRLQELPDVDRAYVHIEPDGWEDEKP
ncbi:cation diffusion facilitator family transporter [Longilinea arvoryzae]|uniref:Cation diffusion facilitator family transporter n=1 Tax=Longilinea arvoryzae TaxID=360412 RepID=A0A0S7BIJ2_9CHLR|nr:cation diffusion facilitator family transporter [Longilinea arvoryzae]GAP15433.1 cation diffusion facilitator family transporter [Longilinea arvoryzae]